VALAPLIVAVHAQSSQGGPVQARRAFLLGLLTGLIYFGGTVYWTSGVMARFGGIAFPLAVAIAGLLVAYLALFPALFALLLHVLVARGGRAWLWLAPAVWVATEYGRLAIFGGFPWVLLGYSQVTVLPVAQLASIGGVFGLSALLTTSATAAAWAVLSTRGRRWGPLTGVAVAVAIAATWGTLRLSANDLVRAGRPLRVGIVQGNVDQGVKWDPARAEEIFTRYLRLTESVADQGARLVLWPESSTPFYFEYGAESQILRELARRRHLQLLVGSDQWEQATPPRTYNAAFLVNADGTTGGVYRKVHLVPFGEYVPFQRLLFFAKPLVEAVSDFAPGTAVNTLPVEGGAVSTAICYEVVYPGLIREGVLNGSTLLTTITNDAWFGRSSAPWQHFAMAAMRAVEQGRYLVRAANTGISGVVDPYGRVLLQSGLFEEGAWTADVRLIEQRTFYGHTGDWLVWGSLTLTVLSLLGTITKAAKGGTTITKRPGTDILEAS
jgi:apolipoprotein N-acyltransferase